LTVEPLLTEDGHWSRDIEFESKASGQMVPKEYIPAIGRAVKDALVEKAVKDAEPVLLEPIMRLQTEVPEASFGAVQGGLLGKRGLITDCHVHGTMRVIDAKVPLAEMFGYSSEIRSATAGRGTFTMEPLSYEKIPEEIAQQIIL
jgi:elongation factor G